MTAPTPAAVIGAMARSLTDVETVRPIHGADYESSASIDRRTLASHIRAVAADMRSQASICEEQDGSYLSPLMLRTFADRLEGKNENTSS